MKAIVWRLVVALVGLHAAATLAAWLDRRGVANGRHPRVTSGGGCNLRQCDSGAAPTLPGSAPADLIAALVAANRQREQAGSPQAQQDEAAARAALRAQGHSELLGDGDSGVVAITTNPVPLHPRPIAGAEIRVTPLVPLVDVTSFQIHMALSRPEYEKRRFGRRGKWKVS